MRKWNKLSIYQKTACGSIKKTNSKRSKSGHNDYSFLLKANQPLNSQRSFMNTQILETFRQLAVMGNIKSFHEISKKTEQGL